MTLEGLARARPYARPLAVPDWTLGCFHRRSITYATGVADTATTVIWVQSNGLTGDIRIPAGRPDLAGKTSLDDYSPAELTLLAQGDGFVAQTSWRDDHMHWDTFTAFQPYTKWPEPGRLERVGACLVEWAPSRVYVEDWRMQPRCDGLSVGLRLVSETGADGVERPRQGGLVIAGDYALIGIDRREPLPAGRTQDLIAAASDPHAVARQAFDCEIAYAERSGDGYRVRFAVDPFGQGRELFAPDSFAAGDTPDILLQHGGAGDSWRMRRWSVDTLLTNQSCPLITPASPAGLEWLQAERETLLSDAV